MVTFATAIILHAVCTFGVGAALNAVLFWAIQKHTPADLQPFARLLKQTCLTDLCLLAVNIFQIPVALLFFLGRSGNSISTAANKK
jgi:uncharacterized membrane protein